MYSRNNHNSCICPHCGTDNFRAAEVWINKIEDGEPLLCSNCKKTLCDNQSSGCRGSGKKTDWNLSGLLIHLNRTFNVLTFKEDSGQIFYEILLILIVSSVLASGKIRQNLKYLAVWAGIFIILISGYSYRHELFRVKERILAEIIPARGFQKTPYSVSFPVSNDGHFYIKAEVNGIPVMFLADTGASHIMLSPDDARRLGIETDKLRFDRFYETANGSVRGCSIRIADLRMGVIHLKEIGASVNEVGMKDGSLTLYWSE